MSFGKMLQVLSSGYFMDRFSLLIVVKIRPQMMFFCFLRVLYVFLTPPFLPGVPLRPQMMFKNEDISLQSCIENSISC